ncbi:probable phosphoglycerate mutase/uncharacterized phosphatase [Acetitomaculum ruminis DSM 5522]|uniref:Probable phosphoglycerate mutase/uncharacterized phosphatase n=1 Tax=Acetitomaculum ruminis DSM 5522 TaxID=1120918 RepID=A0A1I0YV22_9FIRM|nr:histidine phosphatase family protein [Acetitomaculum ruminis]SFB17164.1 probable phosphoglycerate mutase/uncharacterized phosphatase [Acetitomaculum ruminis DSM 5522]
MIYLIRHGQTDTNKAKLLQGRRDVPLNETGEKQVEEAAKFFRSNGIHFDLVYTSPLIRAQKTAKVIAGEDVKTIIDERITEMDYGPYEGVSVDDPPEEMLTFFRDLIHNPVPEGMEDLASIYHRFGDFLNDIKKEAAGKTVLISTHAIAMKGALEFLTPGAYGKFWSKYIGNCCIYKLDIVDGKFTRPVEFK